MDFGPDVFDEVLDRSVAHVDNFIVSVSNLLVELNQFQRLTFDHLLPLDNVNEHFWDGAILIFEFCHGNAYVVLSGWLELEVKREFMLDYYILASNHR